MRPVSRPNPQQRVLRAGRSATRSASRRRAAWRCRGTAASDRYGRGRSAPRSARGGSAGRPRTSARYSRSSARRRTRLCRRLNASSLRATTSRPDVSRSRRCTMPGALGRPSRGAPSAQRAGERPAAQTGAGMDDDAGGLVDDEQVLVLPGDGAGRRARLPPPARARLPAARSATSSPPASRWLFGRATPSTSTLAAGDEPLRGRARADGRLLGEEAIQPQPRCGLGYAKRDQERSVDAPCRRRGLRSPASIVPTRSTTPTTMQTSARLNAGQ